MFDKLREAFSSLTKVISEKKLSEKDLDEALYNFQLTLLESDVAQEVVDSLVASLKTEMTGLKVERSKDTGSLVRGRNAEATHQVVDFPSRGTALATTIVRGALPSRSSRRLMRRLRRASTNSPGTTARPLTFAGLDTCGSTARTARP